MTFVGRVEELVRLQELLETNRLVSLVGPGGVGKTRLALEFSRKREREFSNGVFVVDLTPLSLPELVPSTVAQTLGLRTEVDRDPVRDLASFLSKRQILVVLDNCEHVIDG
jgi:predicted ATPase